MEHVSVIVQYTDNLPGGVPAVWETRHRGRVWLYLREGLPHTMADHFRAMAVCDSMPGVDFDRLTISVAAVRAVA